MLTEAFKEQLLKDVCELQQKLWNDTVINLQKSLRKHYNEGRQCSTENTSQKHNQNTNALQFEEPDSQLTFF